MKPHDGPRRVRTKKATYSWKKDPPRHRTARAQASCHGYDQPGSDAKTWRWIEAQAAGLLDRRNLADQAPWPYKSHGGKRIVFLKPRLRPRLLCPSAENGSKPFSHLQLHLRWCGPKNRGNASSSGKKKNKNTNKIHHQGPPGSLKGVSS